jgi:hypothetical protein
MALKTKRNGREVPRITQEVRQDEVAKHYANYAAIPQRVVMVSPAPGSTVPRGTKVTLTVADTWLLTPRILAYFHQDLADTSFEQIYARFLGNTEMVRLVTDNRSFASMPTADQATFRRLLSTATPALVTTTARGRDVEAALKTLRGAFTFGTGRSL